MSVPPVKGPNDDEREEILRGDGFMLGTLVLALVNGMHFSPWFDPVSILIKPFAPAFFVTSPLLVFYFTSLFLSTATLIAAGVPAALFERFTGRTQSDTASRLIWMLCAAALAAPAFAGMFGAGR